MAINLATKNAEAIANTFAANAYVASHCGDYFDFTGVKGLKIYTPVTVALTDYTREGANRYGVPQEMQDTVQELVMSQDKGFALTIDRGNNEEQMGAKNAGRMLSLQIAERVVPEVDKYALGVFVRDAGNILTTTAKPTKSDCYFVLWHKSSVLVPSKLSDAKVHTDPPGISGDLLEGRWLFDAFVVGARAKGVAASVKADRRLSAPEISFANGLVTVTAAGASRTKVTLDGTDPRYSDSAIIYSAPMATTHLAQGAHIVRAVAYADGSFTSPVAEHAITIA